MKKKMSLLALTGILAFGLTAGVSASDASETAAGKDTDMRKIIIDTDTGADDAAAIILAACSPEVEIMGVTVLAGNVDLEQGTKNALATLELIGCDAPVYKGSEIRYDGSAITPHSVFGADGMGDMDLIHPEGSAEEEDAVSYILDTVRSNPGELEIVMLGPATNIARAIDTDPKTMKQVKRIWSMGTPGIKGPGNASPVAEFNVYLDAPAYRRVLDFGVPVTVIGLDVCDGESKWSDRDFEKLFAFGRVGQYVTNSFDKIREYYKNNGSADSVMNCDGTAMMCVVCPEFITESRLCHGSCITDPGETYGQVIFYQKGFTYDMTREGEFDYNVTLVCDVARMTCFMEYLTRMGSLIASVY